MLWGAPFDHTVININGETLPLDQWHGAHGLAAAGGLALGLLIVLLVVPVAVFVPLLIVALLLAVVLSVLAGVAALVFSPVILLAALVWLIWRLARRGDKPANGVAP
jgi:membrane protein implicated in regulation of membrane protease activity